MINCPKCGMQIAETASFCSFCGERIAPVTKEDLTETLNIFKANFRREKISWMIAAIVISAITLLLTMFAFLMIFIGITTAEEAFLAMGIVYLLYPILFAPIIIVNWVMTVKAGRYERTVTDDPAGAVERAGNVGI
ncbi:MAG: zinc-ribbon domain-containing protein, partial [Clostridia bacterium]|nr:zinc-ribbon domain-containing protein [Clostridia bacterium]